MKGVQNPIVMNMKGVQNPIVMNNYREALEGAGPKLKEIILDRAAQDRNIDIWQLRELARTAYPEDNG